MDNNSKLLKTIHTLMVASKLKQKNPELSDIFIKKNIKNFPNESDKQVHFNKESNVTKLSDEKINEIFENIKKETSKEAKKNDSKDPRNITVGKFNFLKG